VTIVIPEFPDLTKFMEITNHNNFKGKLGIISFKSYYPKTLRIVPNILDIRDYKRTIYGRYFSDMENCEVYLFAAHFNGIKVYLIKQLAKHNRIIFVASSPLTHIKPYIPKTIKEYLQIIIWKLAYAKEVWMGQINSGHKGFLYTPDKYIRNISSQIITGEERDQLFEALNIDEFRKKWWTRTCLPFSIPSIYNNLLYYSVIYFDEDLVSAGYLPDSNTFRRELGSIFDILNKYVPQNEIAIKYHPGYSGDEILVKVGGILPSFIPADLLYNDNVKIYLSICSTSIANAKNGIVISLADMITFKDNRKRDSLKEGLIQISKSTILLPKSLGELEGILINLKGDKIL